MTDTPPRDPPAGYETSDVNLRGVLWFAGILAAVAVVIHLALWGMFVILKGREDRDKQTRYPLSAAERVALPQNQFGSPATGELPPDPRLEGLTGPDRGQEAAADKVEREEQRLNSSGTDKNGQVHIRIEDAMRRVAEESKPRGREPVPMHYDASGGSNSGRNLPEAKR
jgi:hypothetical protein